jgi:hypothetical protein
MLEALRQNSTARWWSSPTPDDWPRMLAANWRLFASAPMDVKLRSKAAVRDELSEILAPCAAGPILHVNWALSGALVAELQVPRLELECAEVLWRIAEGEDKSKLDLVLSGRALPHREIVTLGRDDLALLGLERTAMHVALVRRPPDA